jgi:ferredoxin
MNSAGDKIGDAVDKIGDAANSFADTVETGFNSVKCDLCEKVIEKSEDIIKDQGCTMASISVAALCLSAGGPANPFAAACAAVFPVVCPELADMIIDEAFDIDDACELMTMC